MKGQALVESFILLTFLTMFFSLLNEDLLSAVDETEKILLTSRAVIWDREENKRKVYLTDEYSLNSRLGLAIEPLNKLIDIKLEGDNLRVTNGTISSNYRMLRLTNSWNSKSSVELRSRPAKFVLNDALSGDIVSVVRDQLSRLFLAKELNSKSLVFGKVDPDIVPREVLSER